jgi:muramidase (phage lysozyme)
MATAAQYRQMLQSPEIRAWLDTIAWAEGGGYDILYGGGTFTSSQHPNRAITAGGYTSTAAGRYQFLYRTWMGIKNTLGLPDFSPINQDIAALELTRQRGALNHVLNGDLEKALKSLGCAWAALPFATCGQRMRSWADTRNYFERRLAFYRGSIPGATTPAPGTPNDYIHQAGLLATVDVPISPDENNALLWLLGAAALIILL